MKKLQLIDFKLLSNSAINLTFVVLFYLLMGVSVGAFLIVGFGLPAHSIAGFSTKEPLTLLDLFPNASMPNVLAGCVLFLNKSRLAIGLMLVYFMSSISFFYPYIYDVGVKRDSDSDSRLERFLGWLLYGKMSLTKELLHFRCLLVLIPKFVLSLYQFTIGLFIVGVYFHSKSIALTLIILIPHCIFDAPAIILAASMPMMLYERMLRAPKTDNMREYFELAQYLIQQRRSKIIIVLIFVMIFVAGQIEAIYSPMIAQTYL